MGIAEGKSKPIEHTRDRARASALTKSHQRAHTSDMDWARLKWLAFAGAVIVASIGVVWYARSPGVASYQASTLLTIPAALMVLGWLHQRLPMWFQWTAASAICLVGPAGYLIVGGDQWWNWGQLTPMPLLLLALFRDNDDEDADGANPVVGDSAGWGPP